MADLGEQNKAYFNNEAATYDQKHGETLDQMLEEIRERIDFIGADWVDDDDDAEDDADVEDGDGTRECTTQQPVRLLDYACGTGMVSRALSPYVTQCVGIDISDNMVAAYNARAENQGLSPDEMHAVQGNLLVADDSALAALQDKAKFFGFDVAAVGLGFHHFDDPGLAARRLVERLRPGGVLMIIDFLPHGAAVGYHAHPSQHTISHHGFSEERMKEVFEAAGAGEGFGIDIIGGVIFKARHGGSEESMRRQVFIARGVKAKA